MVNVFVSTDTVFDSEHLSRRIAALGCGDQQHESVSGGDGNAVKAFYRRAAAGLLGEKLAAALEFCRRQKVAPGFEALVQFCRERSLGLFCVGEGLDVCLQEILAVNGLSDVRLFTNHLERSDEGSGRVSFPYDDAECTRCACCARNLMLTLCADRDRIVFVGCSAGDVCAAAYADVVFAKGALQTGCQRANVSYVLYETMYDVMERLETLLAGKRIRVRREAAMMRRAAFIAE
jgi:2-hydroxy-3-keto-5-methylthiopentenyl-1-phosphate phosphatase